MKKLSNHKIRKSHKTIALCSSASFYKQVIEAEKELKKLGFKILVPLTARVMEKSGDFRVGTYKIWFKDAKNYDRKAFLTKHHFQKISRGDCILVLNYEKNGKKGYIGGAVLAEMAVAFYLNKPIYVLNPIQEDVSYKEEILGMRPIILEGDLRKII